MTVMTPGDEEEASTPYIDAFRSSMYGGAIGDALGFPHEFSREADGGQELLQLQQGAPVSDDTQLACAVADAVARVARAAQNGPVKASEIVSSFRREFIAWRKDPAPPDGAPGHTCLTATSRLADGESVPDSTQWGSKGNGAIMRTHPVGFLDVEDSDSRLRARVALISGGITHSHPSSVVACLVWAEAISAVARGTDTSQLASVAASTLDSCLNGWRNTLLLEWAHAQRPVEEGREGAEVNQFLGNPSAWAEHGVEECGAALERAEHILTDYLGDDPCQTFGSGWTAPDALALSLSMASFYSGDPWAGTERTARSSGDSDTLGCMVGALMGASVGTPYWEDLPSRLPPRWAGKIGTMALE